MADRRSHHPARRYDQAVEAPPRVVGLRSTPVLDRDLRAGCNCFLAVGWANMEVRPVGFHSMTVAAHRRTGPVRRVARLAQPIRSLDMGPYPDGDDDAR